MLGGKVRPVKGGEYLVGYLAEANDPENATGRNFVDKRMKIG
jgi:hypothetical protein